MPAFSVPFSSSPAPTTPESSKHKTDYNRHTHLPPHPSTTPAGLPPSSNGSFTPDGPPPSSLLGSSQLGPGRNLFSSHTNPQSATRSPVARGAKSPLSKSPMFYASDNFSLSRSPLHQSHGKTPAFMKASPTAEVSLNSSFDMEDVPAAEDTLPEGASFGLSVMSNGFHEGYLHSSGTDRPMNQRSASTADYSASELSPRGIKRSRGGEQLTTASGYPSSVSELKPDSTIAEIARTMTSDIQRLSLSEDDNLLEKTNEFLNEVTSEFTSDGRSNTSMALRHASQQLRNLWRTVESPQPKRPNADLQEALSVGPSQSAAPVQKAVFIADLLLWIHHPPAIQGDGAALPNSSRAITQPIPEVLIKWLDSSHNPWPGFAKEVEDFSPSPCAHYNFWDLVFTLVLRGKLEEAMDFLNKADFRCAETATQDGQSNGYTNGQLETIQKEVAAAVEVLEQCPALWGDWHVTGNEWAMFRNAVRRALNDLVRLSEEQEEALGDSHGSLNVSRSTHRHSTLSHSVISDRAPNPLPSTMRQRLKAMYGILLGNEPEITSSAQDWVEATVGMAIWWSGDDAAPISIGDLTGTRRSLKATRLRLVETDPLTAYLVRLSHSFQRATNANVEDEFQLNTNNPVEVALACVFQSNFEAALRFLHIWSLPVTDAVAEIATLGGWFSLTPQTSSSLRKNFDEEDLMILSTFEDQRSTLRRDTIMVEYAHSILGDENISLRWRLSLDTLARIGDDEMCRKEITKVVTKIPIDTKSQMNDVLEICLRYQLLDEGCRLAENFADCVLENSQDYGTALIYYARGRARSKLKNVIDLLLSMTLVRSSAFPPRSGLDDDFQELLDPAQSRLKALSMSDPDAASMIATLMSGYATMREFYEIRDETQHPTESNASHLSVERRLRLALPRLLAVIRSGAKTVDGGLYDKDQESIVPVDGLIVLFGEALAYVNDESHSLTTAECFTLLQAVEGLESVGDEPYTKCEDCLRSTLASYHGRTLTSSPQQLLKTMSSMTSTSSFSLVGSSLLDSQSSDEVMVDSHEGRRNRRGERDEPEVKRGWDWRAGVAKDAKSEDVLRMLRLGLAKIIARHWIEGKE